MGRGRAKFGEPAVTLQDCLALAGRLRAEAEIVTNPDPKNARHDPYLKPYKPSDDAVRKLVQRKRAELEDYLRGKHPDLSDDEIAEMARAQAPAKARFEMEWRAAHAERQRRDEEKERQRSDERLASTRRQVDRERDRIRRQLTPGQRIDNALARLALVASASQTTAYGEKPPEEAERDINQCGPNGTPLFPGDPTGEARAIAAKAAREIEDLVDRHTRRDLADVA